MRKNLRHPIDRTGLNLCKSVKSVGQKTLSREICGTKKTIRKNLRHLRNLRDLITCGLSRLDRIGRFPFKFRA